MFPPTDSVKNAVDMFPTTDGLKNINPILSSHLEVICELNRVER